MVQGEVNLVSLFSMQNVNKTYETITGGSIEAIRNVSFELQEGEILGIVGPSGCGKSTILRLMSGLEQPTGGKITKGEKTGKFLVGFIFQDSSLARWRTVHDNI
jgi:NitT/TauT family transport system ATP-binding protein